MTQTITSIAAAVDHVLGIPLGMGKSYPMLFRRRLPPEKLPSEICISGW